jgi:hypothetical protein
LFEDFIEKGLNGPFAMKSAPLPEERIGGIR